MAPRTSLREPNPTAGPLGTSMRVTALANVVSLRSGFGTCRRCQRGVGGTMVLTHTPQLHLCWFTFSLTFCSETKRSNDGVGRNSQGEILLGRFGWFLVLFAEQAFHLRCRGWKTKVVDPQSQTPSWLISGPSSISASSYR